MNNKIRLLFLITFLINLSSSVPSTTPAPDDEWDYLMFSQRWPITGCAEWEETKPNNTCNLPNDKSLWTIHGIWPSKTGTNGPNNCDSAVNFDPDQLQPLMTDLETYWINVEANTKPYSFWKHEWSKHGKCAVTLPELNSVYNFFNQGLKWNKQFVLGQILSAQNVLPKTEGYTLDDINNALRASINKTAMIHCVTDSVTKESLISEIRICFDKSLALIDCVATNLEYKVGDVYTDCSKTKPVMYLNNLPSKIIKDKEEFYNELQEHYQEQNSLINFYRFLKFLIWFTL